MLPIKMRIFFNRKLTATTIASSCVTIGVPAAVKFFPLKNLLLPEITFIISSKKDSSNIVTSVTVDYVGKERA